MSDIIMTDLKHQIQKMLEPSRDLQEQLYQATSASRSVQTLTEEIMRPYNEMLENLKHQLTAPSRTLKEYIDNALLKSYGDLYDSLRVTLGQSVTNNLVSMNTTNKTTLHVAIDLQNDIAEQLTNSNKTIDSTISKNCSTDFLSISNQILAELEQITADEKTLEQINITREATGSAKAKSNLLTPDIVIAIIGILISIILYYAPDNDAIATNQQLEEVIHIQQAIYDEIIETNEEVSE